MTSPPKHPNRLIHETSPYLRQHAYNPVDWYPWGPEALAKARAEDKPILLSIGYSACHWCHVMERECFENEAIAALMNAHFVNIKVDREERPDLDHLYQSVVQLMTGQGGWPLTVFLTPEQEPFYGGTYFPPDDRYGRPGFPRVLRAVAEAYRQRRGDIAASVQQIREALQRLSTFAVEGETALTPELLAQAARGLLSQMDTVHGGFGSQPKFPNATNLEFLLRYWHRSGDQRVLDLVTLTLDAMARGGIYDQLGGGFHRYAVDERWRVPHFEKMLYDNAQLLPLYAHAYQITGSPLYARVVRETLAYLEREMWHPEGGFYATQDADSEGEEGKFYVWRKAEVDALLGEASRLVCRYYDITETGNWEHGKNILHLTLSPEQLASLFDRPLAEVTAQLEAAKAVLFAAREKRVKPFRDEKILTAWNGLLLSGLLEVANVLGETRVVPLVQRTFAFIERHLLRDGQLLRVYKDGQAKLPGYLDDYALFIAALLDAFESLGEARYFRLALTLTEVMLEEFWDEAQGGFFFTGKHHEALLARPKQVFDQALPAGMAVATHVLLRLYHLTGRADYLQRAERVLRGLASAMAQHPFGFGSLLCALDFYLDKPLEVVIMGAPQAPATQALRRCVYQHYLPNRLVVPLDPQQYETLLQDLPPLRDLLAGKAPINGQPTAYVCHDFTCSAPVTDPAALAPLLRRR